MCVHVCVCVWCVVCIVSVSVCMHFCVWFSSVYVSGPGIEWVKAEFGDCLRNLVSGGRLPLLPVPPFLLPAPQAGRGSACTSPEGQVLLSLLLCCRADPFS